MLFSRSQPVVIAGPCAAESYELMNEVGQFLKQLSEELGFTYIFKASFDKANRTSNDSARGQGISKVSGWFEKIKSDLGVMTLTDIHESYQAAEAAKFCDVLQIPAFLCRQTDLVVAAAKTGRYVNIKKGQFMAPGAMSSVVQKARDAAEDRNNERVWITERGASFGYGNLVVDMRAFPIMAESKAPVIFDITHSTQLPAQGGSGGQTSGGQRQHAPTLARAATATGYLDGYFLEVHTDPSRAISDKDAQLNMPQAEALLRQLIPLWKQSREFSAIDDKFRT